MVAFYFATLLFGMLCDVIVMTDDGDFYHVKVLVFYWLIMHAFTDQSVYSVICDFY